MTVLKWRWLATLVIGQEVEVAAGVINVGANLAAKLLNGRELNFRAQAPKKKQLDLRFGGQFQRVEVEQVSLDGKRFRAKGWAVANVGYGIEALFRHARARDVDAVTRHQFVVAAEVDGRDCVFGAKAAATARIGNNAERAAQEVAGVADVAFRGDELAHAAAGNGMAANAHLGINLNFKSELTAELGQLLHVAFGFASETEVEAFMQLARVQSAVENLFGELAWGEQGKVAGERQQQHRLQPGGREQAQLDGQRRDEGRRGIGMEDANGMGIKSYGQGGRMQFTGASHYLAQNVLMGAVDPVKIADGKHSAP